MENKNKILELQKKSQEVLKELGLDNVQKLTNEEGEIFLLGKRWVLIEVNTFPGGIIKSIADIMGERMANEFIYRFGYNYGEDFAEEHLKRGIPKEKIPKLRSSLCAIFTGWVTAEPLELDFEKGRYVAKLYNDFETESARLNNMEPSVNFLRGMLAGIFSKLIGAKTHATSEFSDDGVIVTVEKRS